MNPSLPIVDIRSGTSPIDDPSVAQQLDEGIRGLMLDAYEKQNQAVLCHSSCLLGRISLRESLETICAFLNANPKEIITLFFENYASPESIYAAFEQSGCLELIYTHKPKDPWPTLTEMASEDQRLVVFADEGGGAYPWLHDMWDFNWENHWHYEAVEEFDCSANRGSPDNTLFILNHFLTNPIALEHLAEEANQEKILMQQIDRCSKEHARTPNFIAVDFYSIGDVLEVVDQLNLERVGSP